MEHGGLIIKGIIGLGDKSMWISQNNGDSWDRPCHLGMRRIDILSYLGYEDKQVCVEFVDLV